MELIDNFQEETWRKGNYEITKGKLKHYIRNIADFDVNIQLGDIYIILMH